MNTRHDGLKALVPLLRCPLCRSGLISEANRFVCNRGHAFDRARQGYLNLLTHPVSTKYDKALFTSRRFVWQSGLWDPLVDLLAQLLTEQLESDGNRLLLLDAGCGEGSLLRGVWNRLSQGGYEAAAIGLDSAKDAVRMAASACPDQAWCVADLAGAPIADYAVHAVLNVLSPANYDEFARMLKPDGIVLKVVPNRDYLRELRNALYASNLVRPVDALEQEARTVQLFRSRTSDVQSFRLRYRRPLDITTASHLVNMTPLGWQAGAAEKEALLDRLEPVITVDLTVLVGRPSR